MSARELVVGWHGLSGGIAHMHDQGIIDHDIHLNNLLLSACGKLWVKTDLGNAAWCMVQPEGTEPTFIDFPL